MMIKTSSFLSDLNLWYISPSSNNCIIIFIIADRNRIVNDVSDCVDKLIDLGQQCFFFLFHSLLFEFILIFELDLFFTGVFFVGFLFISDDLANIIPLFLERIKLISYYLELYVLFLQSWSRSMMSSTSFGSLNLRSRLLRMIFGSYPFSALNQFISKPPILKN